MTLALPFCTSRLLAGALTTLTVLLPLLDTIRSLQVIYVWHDPAGMTIDQQCL